MNIFKVGDQVVDPYSFDGVGTVVSMRRADSRIVSGAVRALGGVWVKVQFDRTTREVPATELAHA